jgi:hypothetical protein
MKGMKGWFNEHYRHYLASKGVRTAVKNPITVVDFNRRYFDAKKKTTVDEAKDYIAGVMIRRREYNMTPLVEFDEVKDFARPSEQNWDLSEPELREAFDRARLSVRTAEIVRHKEAEPGKEPVKIDESGLISKEHDGVFSVSLEAGDIAEAAKMRKEGTALKGGGEATAANIRSIIKQAGFKLNPYAMTYVDSLDDSEAMYGEDGVRTQAVYIAVNLRAATPEQKEAKKKLIAISKGGKE